MSDHADGHAAANEDSAGNPTPEPTEAASPAEAAAADATSDAAPNVGETPTPETATPEATAAPAPPAPPAPVVEVYGERPSPRAMLGYIKPTLWGLVAVYVLAFLLLNRTSTRINFVVFTADVPLFVGLFVMVALGAALAVIALWQRRRGQHKAHSDTPE